MDALQDATTFFIQFEKKSVSPAYETIERMIVIESPLNQMAWRANLMLGTDKYLNFKLNFQMIGKKSIAIGSC